MGPTILFHKYIKEAPGLQLGDVPQLSYREKQACQESSNCAFPIVGPAGFFTMKQIPTCSTLHDNRGQLSHRRKCHISSKLGEYKQGFI